MTTNVVILGAGFGGLELATRLSDDLAGEVSVTLIDKSDSFIFGYSKLAVMFGLAELDGVRAYYGDIAKDSVEFRQETITSIDPASRRHRRWYLRRRHPRRRARRRSRSRGHSGAAGRRLRVLFTRRRRSRARR